MGEYLFKEEIILECGAKVIVENKKNDFNHVYITVYDIDGEKILNRRSKSKLEWENCKGYYCMKMNILLQESGKLSHPFVMLECGDRMYKVCDLDYRDSHRELLRSLSPIGYYTEESGSYELYSFGGLYDIFVYEKDCIVFRFDEFYFNGECIGTWEEVENIFSSRYDIDYNAESMKQYFEDKLGIKIKSYSTENASGEFGDE